ncbi:hypothetical protein [Azovibrio restrictus]|uniref:hypothetical protein n=1 Tax=Azovibrio restrictus TaxID=146938 RepID=UPI0026EA19D1|nr:hypothetical protein [Azovibrio restrictus]
MSTPEQLNKLHETLAEVIQKHTEATGEHALLHAQWTEAAAAGDDAKADKLEIAIEKASRLVQRLELRRNALAAEIGDAEQVERAARAAKLKQTADSILARAGKRLADMEPLAAALAKAVDELESDFADWREARYFAQQAGAAPEGFATQENDRRVSRLSESLGMSKIRASNIAKEMSRISVFQ